MENNELNLPGYEIPDELKNVVSVTALDRIYNWGRRSSVWPCSFCRRFLSSGFSRRKL